MKLLTDMLDGGTLACGNHFAWSDHAFVGGVTHDAAAAHALMQEIANLREASEHTPSSAGRLTLNLLSALDRRAGELMRQWGFEK